MTLAEQILQFSTGVLLVVVIVVIFFRASK
jgi:hypothetical protein